MGRLGLSVTDFWSLSPARFFAMLESYEVARKQDREVIQRAAALVSATLVNTRVTSKRRKAAAVEDFMPKPADHVPARVQSTQEQLGAMLAWASVLQG